MAKQVMKMEAGERYCEICLSKKSDSHGAMRDFHFQS